MRSRTACFDIAPRRSSTALASARTSSVPTSVSHSSVVFARRRSSSADPWPFATIDVTSAGTTLGHAEGSFLSDGAEFLSTKYHATAQSTASTRKTRTLRGFIASPSPGPPHHRRHDQRDQRHGRGPHDRELALVLRRRHVRVLERALADRDE